MNSVTERLCEEIKRSGYSYGELSKLTGIPKSAIQRYATGETVKIPLDRLSQLASSLNVTSAYLMGWEEDNHEKQQNNDIILSPEEIDLILRWREADDKQKKDASFILLSKEEQRLIKLYRRADEIDKGTIWNILSRYDEEGSSALESTG